MDLHLTGKRALICASSRGIGLAIAEALAGEGCDVFLCGRDAAKLAAAAELVQSRARGSVGWLATDLSDVDQAQNLWSTAAARWGGIDILVNNVGGPPPTTALSTSINEWRRGFDQLFLSSVTLSQLAAAEMATRGFGRIIFITSITVVEPIDHLAISTSMRAAVTAFGKTLASEVAAQGITVNTVMPGIIHTKRIEDLRQARAARQGTTFAEEMEKTRQSIPAKRLGDPAELASFVTFLSSPHASYLTGLNIPVDGGLRRSW